MCPVQYSRHTYIKKVFVVFLKFGFRWASCTFQLASLEREHLWDTSDSVGKTCVWYHKAGQENFQEAGPKNRVPSLASAH